MARTATTVPVVTSANARARKRGNRWEGQFRFGGYWFPVKRRGRVATYASAAAAWVAAHAAQTVTA